MSEVAATPPARKPRAKRIPSLGFETKSITIDLPVDMHKKFESAALKDRLPLKMYLVRELDGLNAKPAPVNGSGGVGGNPSLLNTTE